VLSERLEEIRATIINNMLAYHPESRDSLAAGRKPAAEGGATLGTRPPTPIPTTISISAQASGARSALQLFTTDRPGLLVDIVRVLKDCSLNVVSASINTVVRVVSRCRFLLLCFSLALACPG
jgi:UTP:GlnB (protein PII) uridylyltransferase